MQLTLRRNNIEILRENVLAHLESRRKSRAAGPVIASDTNSPDASSVRDAYRVAIDEWIRMIRAEQELAYASPTIWEADIWKEARLKEEHARLNVNKAAEKYEDLLRRSLFDL